jgi:hypothetical protein
VKEESKRGFSSKNERKNESKWFYVLCFILSTVAIERERGTYETGLRKLIMTLIYAISICAEK